MSFIAQHTLQIFLGGLIGARLVFIIQNAKYFLFQFNLNHFLEMFYIWDKNLSFWGGVFGIILTLVYICRKEKENLAKWLDITSVAILGGMIFGYIGAYFDGRNYGNETSLPWGILLESSRFAVPIHPTQIYGAIYTAILTFILFRISQKKLNQKDGFITLVAVSSYSLLRFLEEFLRGDEANFYFIGLRDAQVYCLIAFLGASALLFLRYRKQPHNS